VIGSKLLATSERLEEEMVPDGPPVVIHVKFVEPDNDEGHKRTILRGSQLPWAVRLAPSIVCGKVDR
jgi:hypothetical protein